MKSKLANSVLALAIFTPTAMAGKGPSAGVMQNQNPTPPAANLVVPGNPRFRAPDDAVPREIVRTVLPEILRRLAPPAGAQAPVASPPSGQRRTKPTPVVPAREAVVRPAIRALDSLAGERADAIREAERIANGLESIENLRASGFGSDLPHGLPEFSRDGRGPQGPGDPFAGNPVHGRKPTAPGHISSNLHGGGLTDIRGGFHGSRRGTPGTTDDLSPTTNRIVDGSSRMTFGHGPNSTAAGPVVVHQDEDTGEFTASQTGTDVNGNQARIDVTQHTDERGQVSGTTEVITTSNGDTCTTRTIERDATGAILSDKTEKTTPGTQACDRGTGDVATGGPVGPGAAAITGLVPLDLLRQPLEEERSGGTNTMLHGRLGNNQVNPGSRNDAVPFPGSKRNNVGPIIGGLAGPMEGGSNGGSDRPD